MTAPALDLSMDPGPLTAAICDIESVSGNEDAIADAVEAALRESPHLRVERDGNTVFAFTDAGRSERVVVAGHLDTVPVDDNLPCRVDGGRISGCGTTDMKGGVAVALRLAASVPEPDRDVTYVFYDCEEVEAAHNGLLRVSRNHPDWLAADFAVLMEPTNATVEGGCQGSMRVEVTVRGRRAHTARSWKGINAIHAAGAVLDRLRAYEAAEVEIDGLVYREGMNAVGISGGVAGNVIPDECTVSVNYRFAPDQVRGRGARRRTSGVRRVRGVALGQLARGAARACRSRQRRPSSPRSARSRGRSSAGPTSRGSRRWGSRRSTTGRATRTSRTPARSTSTSR